MKYGNVFGKTHLQSKIMDVKCFIRKIFSSEIMREKKKRKKMLSYIIYE